MIKFGIIGAGNIANTFCKAMNESVENGELYAVASRSIEKATEYQKEYGFTKAYGSYQELYMDSDVEVIYVATPHGLHYEQLLEILDYDKHILCEKSFTLNKEQAVEVFKKAKRKNVFVMEALWTRFLPVIKQLQKEVNTGIIGEVQKIEADFCFDADKSDENRLFNPKLGGGALLDIGIYPITFANLFMGRPSKISSTVTKYHTGVDLAENVIYDYPNGQAYLTMSLDEDKPMDAKIYGAKGQIYVKNFFFTEHATIKNNAGDVIKEIHIPHETNGFEYEIRETIKCIQNNLLESPTMPHEETLAILEQMDNLRASWNMSYPNEEVK